MINLIVHCGALPCIGTEDCNTSVKHKAKNMILYITYSTCVHPSLSAHERAASDVEDHVLLCVAKIWKSSVSVLANVFNSSTWYLKS